MQQLIQKGINFFGGNFTKNPEEMEANISYEAKAMIRQAFAGVEEVYDMHTHIAGIGTGGTGCYVHPDMRSWLHPWNLLKFELLKSTSDARNEETLDQDYVQRLVRLIRPLQKYGWKKNLILAFDHWYDPDGRLRHDLSYLYVPNDYVWNLCAEFPDVFLPCISVHPYRPDALEELDRWGSVGVRVVKWLPNSQGIDPLAPKCRAFYERLKFWNMALLCHTGKDHSVTTPAMDDELGNPLRLRGPLDAGVKVIAAHCASEGTANDLDDPKLAKRPAFELFMRLFDDPKYFGLLFGDVSSMVLVKRAGRPLQSLLDRSDLHSRLLYGTDYPLPANNAIVLTKQFVAKGYITEHQRQCLNEIYDYNPLLFDFVSRRLMRSPSRQRSFLPTVFRWNENLFGARDFIPQREEQTAAGKTQEQARLQQALANTPAQMATLSLSSSVYTA